MIIRGVERVVRFEVEFTNAEADAMVAVNAIPPAAERPVRMWLTEDEMCGIPGVLPPSSSMLDAYRAANLKESTRVTLTMALIVIAVLNSAVSVFLLYQATRTYQDAVRVFEYAINLATREVISVLPKRPPEAGKPDDTVAP